MSVVEQPQQHGVDTEPEQSARMRVMRVRDLLRACGATRDRGERAELLARLADELENTAGELEHTAGERAADDTRAQRYQLVIAGLRGQAGMARVAAAFDDQDRAEHRAAC